MSEPSNTYSSVHPAITDVVSRNRDNIVLVYGNSNRGRYNALAFQIVRSVRRIERARGVATLADGDTLGFGYIDEDGHSEAGGGGGTEVFSVQEEHANTIIEYGLSVPQSGVYVGMETGQGEPITGLREGDMRLRGLEPGDLSERAGVLSDNTYVDDPTPSVRDSIPTTALSERHDQGAVRIDSETDGPNRFHFAFENQSGGQVDVDVVAHGTAYDVRPITDTSVVKDMLEGSDYNRRIIQYGGFGNENPNLPADWYDYRAEIGPGELTP